LAGLAPGTVVITDGEGNELDTFIGRAAEFRGEWQLVERELLRYTWVGAAGETPSHVRYHLEPTPEGTRFTYHHTGFTGIGGFAMARMLGSIRARMLTIGVPALLAELDQTGALRPNTTLRTTLRPTRPR